jgi:hypothetical protein
MLKEDRIMGEEVEKEMTSKQLASAQATAFRGRASWGSRFICDHVPGGYREIAIRARLPDPDWEAYAERMAGCVNAMRGIEDPAALMDEVREVLKECADDLESMVEAHYGGGVKDHPAMKPKYMRDMEPARRARALLDKIGGGE